jgi:hypothetical protein
MPELLQPDKGCISTSPTLIDPCDCSVGGQDTRYKDTDVIMRFFQRWPTDKLYKRLYWDYFRTIAVIMLARVEAIGNERKLMKLQDYLVQNLVELKAKQAMLRSISAGLRRKMMNQSRRSDLRRRMFRKTCRAILVKFFQGWVRFMLWQQGFHKSYELR